MLIRSLPDSGRTWRRVVDASPGAALPHAPEWLPIIQGAYGHDPFYLSAEDGQGRSAVLPAFVVRRPFLGAVVTSMPFLDGGGPCGPASLGRILIEHLIAEARGIGAKSIEFRSTERLDLGVAPFEHKVNMTLAIPGDPDCLWRGLDKDVRYQIRKAERAGLTVDSGGAELLSPFYDVFAVRMRELGSPVHARRFLASVLEHFGTRARVLLVRQDLRVIGGLIAIAFKDRLTVPWASCLKDTFRCVRTCCCIGQPCVRRRSAVSAASNSDDPRVIPARIASSNNGVRKRSRSSAIQCRPRHPPSVSSRIAGQAFPSFQEPGNTCPSASPGRLGHACGGI